MSQQTAHQNNHSGKARGSSCDICRKVFTSAHQLAQHARVHTGEKPYKCEHCERSFKQLSHLQQHTRLHTGERPYKCSELSCGRSFIQLSNLQQHSKTHGGSDRAVRVADRRYFCAFCRKSFKQRCSLSNHEASKHSAGGTSSATTGELVQLDQHPAGGRNSTGSVSSSSSSSSSSSTTSIIVSTSMTPAGGTKLSFCDRCGQVFINDYSLLTHLQQMVNDPKHQIDLSQEKQAQEQALQLQQQQLQQQQQSSQSAVSTAPTITNDKLAMLVADLNSHEMVTVENGTVVAMFASSGPLDTADTDGNTEVLYTPGQ